MNNYSFTYSLTHSDERNFKLFEQMMREGKAIRQQREEEERIKNGLPPVSVEVPPTPSIESKENVRINDSVVEQQTIDVKWKKIEIEEVDDEILPPVPSSVSNTTTSIVTPPAPPSSNNLDELD